MDSLSGGFSGKVFQTTVGVALGLGLVGARRGVDRLVPYIQSLFRTNEEQAAELEDILHQQNNDIPEAPFEDPNDEIAAEEENQQWEQDELIAQPLPAPLLEPAPLPLAPIDSFEHLDENLKKLFPSLELSEFKLQLVRLAADLAKHPVHFRLGRDKITSEEAKSLFLNWMAWKIQNAAITNNALHFVTDCLENMKSMNGEQLIGYIEATLANFPNGNDTFEQWKINGTMHGVHDFAVANPELCVAATDLIDQIIFATSGDDEQSTKKAAVVKELQTALEQNTPIAAQLIGTGMLMQKSHPHVVRNMLTLMGNDESLTFATISFVTSFFNLINKDQETTESVKVINQQIVQIIDEKPEVFNQIVEVAKEAIAMHPELVPALAGAIEHAQTVIEKNPEKAARAIKAVPYALDHPKQVGIAIKVAEIIVDSAGDLHKAFTSTKTDSDDFPFVDCDGFPIRVYPRNTEYQSPKAIEYAKTGLAAASKIMKILEVAKEEEVQKKRSGVIVEASELPQTETAVVLAAETSSPEVVQQESIAFFWHASETIGNAALKSFIEEKDKMLDGMSHKVGAQGVNRVIDLTIQARAGDFDHLTTEEITYNIGVGTLQFLGEVIKTSLISSAQKIAYDAIKAGVVQYFPDAGARIPSYETASFVFQVTNTVYTEASADIPLADRAVNTLVGIEKAALSMVIAPVTATLAQRFVRVPILSSFVAGAAESLITRSVLGLQGQVISAIRE